MLRVRHRVLGHLVLADDVVPLDQALVPVLHGADEVLPGRAVPREEVRAPEHARLVRLREGAGLHVCPALALGHERRRDAVGALQAQLEEDPRVLIMAVRGLPEHVGDDRHARVDVDALRDAELRQGVVAPRAGGEVEEPHRFVVREEAAVGAAVYVWLAYGQPAVEEKAAEGGPEDELGGGRLAAGPRDRGVLLQHLLEPRLLDLAEVEGGGVVVLGRGLLALLLQRLDVEGEAHRLLDVVVCPRRQRLAREASKVALLRLGLAGGVHGWGARHGGLMGHDVDSLLGARVRARRGPQGADEAWPGAALHALHGQGRRRRHGPALLRLVRQEVEQQARLPLLDMINQLGVHVPSGPLLDHGLLVGLVHLQGLGGSDRRRPVLLLLGLDLPPPRHAARLRLAALEVGRGLVLVLAAVRVRRAQGPARGPQLPVAAAAAGR
mmetsp:Transcript_5646/g.16654  ORF Transcript_5646/g.16654 Transcript_5646/m.16654 type:complete len:439 (+) Transcript_5646:2207-3523(+)